MEPLIGANILVPGTATGTVSNFDGIFQLEIPSGTEQLHVSYGCCFDCQPYLQLCGQDEAIVVLEYKRGRSKVVGYNEDGRNICRSKSRKRIPRQSVQAGFATIRSYGY